MMGSWDAAVIVLQEIAGDETDWERVEGAGKTILSHSRRKQAEVIRQ